MTDSVLDGNPVTYEVAPSESLSEGVVAAVAAATDAEPILTSGADPGEVLDPLYTAVDAEALDEVFRASACGGPTTAGTVTFTYEGRDVTVHSDGRVVVAALDEPSD